MTTITKQRGRPKGTGLDDRHNLKAIAALISNSEELKPTTAIRSLGITNPSTIRRLRDKFNCARHDLLAQALIDQKSLKEQLRNTPRSIEPRVNVQTATSHSQSSEATCALKTSADPAIYEVANVTKRKGKRSSARTPHPKPITKSATDYEPSAQDIIGAWISFCSQFTLSAAQTQIEVLKELQALPFAAQSQLLHTEVFTAWMKAMAPKTST